MPDEEGVVEDPKETVEEEPKEPAEPDPIESLAKEMGWNPDHKGTDREFVDARSYIVRSREIQDTMRKQLRSQGSQITELSDQLTNGIRTLQEHNRKVSEAKISELETQITALKDERRQAIVDGEPDKVDDIDTQIDGLNKAKTESIPEVVAPPPAKVHPEFAAWHESNAWFNTDAEMTDYTNALVAEHPGLTYSRLLKLVDTKVRDAFPDKFDAPAAPGSKTPTEPVATMEGAPPKRKAGKSFSSADLTDGQRSSMRQLVKMGVVTEKDYIQELVDIGEIS